MKILPSAQAPILPYPLHSLLIAEIDQAGFAGVGLSHDQLLPRRVEFIFEADVNAEVRASAVCFAQAFADGTVDGEVFE